MIEMLEGVPGSGKSYYAVSERFLSWVRSNRKIYIYVDGIYLDRLGAFENRTVEELQKQIVVWNTPDEVRNGLLEVESGSAVIIDEAQTIFRSKERVEPELLRMLETHRHKGIDIVIMCQQHGQMTLGVLRLIEVTTKFRRLDRFGLKGRYQGAVRGNPEETEVIRMFTGRYKPDVYAYYSSYSNAAVRESARGGSILKSPMVLIGIAGLVGAVVWFGTGRWLTAPADVQARGLAPVPQLLAVSPVKAEVLQELVPQIHPLRVHGGMQIGEQWLYVTEEGRLMSDDELARESGGVVNARFDRGSRILYGSGVIWGGEKPIIGMEVTSALPSPSVTVPDNLGDGSTAPYVSGNAVDLLKTPADLR